MTDFVFRNDGKHHRYEAYADDTFAGYVEYEIMSTGIIFSHTEVLPAFEGKGVGGFLARESLAAARSQGKRVIPACPFIASYLRKHREFIDLVESDVQRAYQI